jgi:hypothetical protein
MNTNVSLLQATKSLEWVWDLERIWSFVLCLGAKSRDLVLNVMAKNLDALKCGGWGVFIAPTTKMVVGVAVCRWVHRTVWCATGYCPVRQPHHPTVRVRPLELWQPGPPDSPDCSLFGAPSDATLTLRALFAVSTDRWSRPLRWRPLLRLAHQTVWCYTGQSGEL